MKKVFIFLFLSLAFLYAEVAFPEIKSKDLEQKGESKEEVIIDEAQNSAFVSKILYVKEKTLPSKILYVNEVIPYKITLLVLSQYSALQTEFFSENESVEVLNPKETWVLRNDGTLENTFYLKIKKVNYTIPSIKITANTPEGQSQIEIEKKQDRAIFLERKADFSQVIASSLNILDSKVTSYDSQNNLAVLQLEATLSNLFDFKLFNYAQQGIESKSGDYKKAIVFYYVIIPKNTNEVAFEYFNTVQSKYLKIAIPNISQDERVSTQSDIKPKNNMQLYQVLGVLVLALVFFGLFLYKRKLLFMLASLFCLVIVFYLLSVKSSAVLRENIAIRIQPTLNSTIVLVTKNALKVEILSHKRGYYKVLLEDDRIGWVRESDVKN